MAVPPVAAAPLIAVVVTLCLPSESSVKLVAPVRAASFSSSARSVGCTTLTATDAPMPSLPPLAPVPAGNAFEVLFVSLCETKLSEPARTNVEPVGMVAEEVSIAMLMASEPATPTFVAPAPEVACAE